ncbi:MAG TPA: glutathione S-transferase N-terminal domain-containing protein [Solirubrobacteraceae bacterium]|nr:glutathione S-transferase N-terminal domain-containing protein [Solirubrobacteraceae bacterium]
MASRKVKLYMFSGSAPSLTARLMLEHKGIDHKAVHLMVGPHAFGMLGRGFETMTVPALKIDGRRVQGSREISRALDELVPQPPLFPADPQRRRWVQEAEEWGEELQDAARRLLLCAAKRDRRAFLSVYRHANPLMRPAQRVSCGFVTRLATAGHRATDRAGERDLAVLPARLDQIDAWIAQGLLDSAELNAADFQIAPNVALLLRFEDLAPYVASRPAARLAHRVAPDFPGEIPAVLPSAWLAALHGDGAAAAGSGQVGTRDVLQATDDGGLFPASLREDAGALPSWRYGR